MEDIDMISMEDIDKDSMEDIGIITDILNKENILLTDDDIEKRLQAFHQKHHKAKTFRMATWAKLGIGTAAAIALALVMHKAFVPANNTVTLQTTNKGLVADHYTMANGQTQPIAAPQKGAMGDEQLESQNLEKLFADADTIKLNVSQGHSCRVVLPDGSCAYVHPNTKLMYPKQFVGSERRVTLNGEAYFVVKKDKEHPFIVATASSETLVTGTEFNVEASERNHSGVKVTLVNGSVQFSNRQTLQRVFLSPGEAATLRDGNPIHVNEADTMRYVAWRDGYFYFDDVKLEDILRQISQSYNVKTVCSNPKLTQYRMHLMLRRNQELSEVVESLNKMKKVRVRLVNGKLYVE